MSTEHFDFLVLGGGSAGYAAARTAREVLDRVAIVDGAEQLGGLCILRGCMPSKTLIYSTEVLHLAQKGKVFGLEIPEARADLPALHRRKLDLIGEFTDYRVGQLESDRFSLFRHHARFTGPKTVALDDGRELSADKIVIATGSKVQVPPVPGLADLEGAWTSDDVLDLDFLPESVLMLGGGVVACELAQFLARAGSQVIQIQRSKHIIHDVSAEAAETVETVFREEGIELLTGTNITDIRRDGEEFVVTFEQDGKTLTRRARHLVNALGRTPNTDGLNLGAAGVHLHRSGHINTRDYGQTDNPDVYAVGDVAGPHEIVHTAIIQGEAAAKHATNRKTREPRDWPFLSVIFTDPQVAVAGRNEAMLKDEGIDFVSADHPWDDHGKSMLMEARHGYVRVFADRQGLVLGAEIVGKDAGELIHAFAVAIQMKATVTDLLDTPWYHPTLSEMVTYPLEEIAEELGML